MSALGLLFAATAASRTTSAPLKRLAGGNVRVNSVPAVPSYQLTRLGSGNVRVETV